MHKPNTFVSCDEKLGRKCAQVIPTDNTFLYRLSVWFAHHVCLATCLATCWTSILKQCLLPKTLHILHFHWIMPYPYSSQLLSDSSDPVEGANALNFSLIYTICCLLLPEIQNKLSLWHDTTFKNCCCIDTGLKWVLANFVFICTRVVPKVMSNFFLHANWESRRRKVRW